VDMKAPVGRIEGNQFTGSGILQRCRPPDWKVSTEFPKFMIDLGYEKDGLRSPRYSSITRRLSPTCRSTSHPPIVIRLSTSRKLKCLPIR
jgi:hypothetical protein